MGTGFVMVENLLSGEGPFWYVRLPLFALFSVFSVFSGQVLLSG